MVFSEKESCIVCGSPVLCEKSDVLIIHLPFSILSFPTLLYVSTFPFLIFSTQKKEEAVCRIRKKCTKTFYVLAVINR